jgi:threonine aldolase
VATGRSLVELAAPFDVVSVALSKGLGCPVGSVIAGSAAAMTHAVRARRMFGGAMRQSGILAAAGVYALQHNIERLAEDHVNARILADGVAGTRAEIDLATVQTNIVIFRVPEPLPDAATVVRRAQEHGVLISAFAPRTVRAVTHLNVDAEQCRYAAQVIARAVEG